MPVVTFDRKEFEKALGKKLPLEQLKERISMLGTDLEEINDDEIIVEIFPNRPDLLSIQGFARALSSFIRHKKGLRKYNVKKGSYSVIVESSVKDVRPFTACAVVKNLKFDDEKIKDVIQIQEKLHITFGRNRKRCAIGIYPMEHIEWPIHYLARDPYDIKFTPLESSKEMNGYQILRSHPTGQDYAHLLEGMKKFPIFEDANGSILSMPPIINSHDTGKITSGTKDVFIETSGSDLNVVSDSVNMIAAALSDMGGDLYSVNVSYGSKKITTPDLKPGKIKIKLDYVNNLLGLNLKDKDVKQLLERMGFAYSSGIVQIPAYRIDILHPIDIVEEIAIAYGYENFEPEIPNVSTIGEEDAFEVFKSKISKILTGLGLLEVNTYHIGRKENFSKKMNTTMKTIELENPQNFDFNSLRSWIIPCLMEVLENNQHHEYPQKIFDIGTVFQPSNATETKIEEFDRLAVAVSHDKADFTKIKQILDYLMRMLAVEYEIEEVDHDSFIPGRVGRLKANGKKLAYVGEIHPEVLANWSLEYPVVVFELNLTELFGTLQSEE